MTTRKLVPRDPAKTPAYFQKVAALWQKSIDHSVGLESIAVLNSVAHKCCLVAQARYSAGEELGRCREALATAATHFQRFIAAAEGTSVPGIPTLAWYLEHASAAYLTGSGAPCVASLRKSKLDKLAPWERSVYHQICDALDDEVTSASTADETGAPKAYGPAFTRVLRSAVEGDARAFLEDLDHCLERVWGPLVDEGADDSMSTRPPSYSGRWLWFSAALSLRVGAVPSSATALRYCPVELIAR